MAHDWRKKQDERVFEAQLEFAALRKVLLKRFPDATFNSHDKHEDVKQSGKQSLEIRLPEKASYVLTQGKDGFDIYVDVVPSQKKDEPRKKAPSEEDIKDAIATLATALYETKKLQGDTGTFVIDSISPASMEKEVIRALLIDDKKLNDKDKKHEPKECRRFEFVKFGDKTYQLNDNNEVVEYKAQSETRASALFQFPEGDGGEEEGSDLEEEEEEEDALPGYGS